MKWGYLYFSASTTTTFDQKVEEACTWYRKKYGRLPDVIIVHPFDVPKLTITPPDKIQVEGCEITVMSWEHMITGCIGPCCRGDETNQPVAAPKDSEVVSAFIQHARKVKA